MRRLPASLAIPQIKDVWRESRDATSGPGAPGVDGVRAGQFASDLATNILRIREDIRAGNYRFNRLRLARVEKDNGGIRILAIPTVRDRLVQRSILRHLEADGRFQPTSPISYGFTKARKLPDAQRLALEHRRSRPWVLKADIVRFFDQIPREKVKTLVHRRVGWKVVAELLCQAVDCELWTPNPEDVALVSANGIKPGRGLRQGMPVSPMLANLLLKRFDEQLTRAGITAIRYADDIAVFANSRPECEAALGRIQNLLAHLDLKVPDLLDEDKTSIYGPSDAVEFLGVEIRRHADGYKLHAPAAKIAKIERSMSEIADLTRCIEARRNIGQVVRALDSFVIGHTAAMAVLDDDGGFLARLEAAKRKQLRRLLVELVGEEPVAKLTENQLAVLGAGPFIGR